MMREKVSSFAFDFHSAVKWPPWCPELLSLAVVVGQEAFRKNRGIDQTKSFEALFFASKPLKGRGDQSKSKSFEAVLRRHSYNISSISQSCNDFIHHQLKDYDVFSVKTCNKTHWKSASKIPKVSQIFRCPVSWDTLYDQFKDYGVFSVKTLQ